LDRPHPHSEPDLKNALDTFEGVCKTKLLMTLDGKSPLGIKLLAFKKFVADNLGDIAKHAAEKNELETKLKDPGADISVLNSRIDDKNKLIEVTTSLIKEKVAVLTAFILRVSEKHLALRSKLSVTKSKGNETAGMSFCTLPSDSRITQPKQASPAPVDDIDPRTNHDLIASLTESVEQPIAKILQLFHGYAVKLFEKASETHDVAKVKNTVDALIAWEVGSALDIKIMYACPPTTEDKEKEADQPILQAIISRVIRVLAEEGNISDTSSSVLHDDEHGITSEQIIPSEGDKARGRRIDGTVHPPEEYLSSVLAEMLQLSVEIKTFPLNETKRLKAGKNASKFGVVLTTGSIEVIKMSLTGVGTVDVDLSAIGTGVKAFLGTSEDNGFVLLAGVLKRARRDEIATDEMVSVSQINPGGPPTPLTVQSFLGSGAFSNVVKLGDREFMKIPKAASLAANLKHEANILSLLQGDIAYPGIPIPVSFPSLVSTIQTVVRDELSSMTCLRLQGVVGIPLNKLPRNDWQASAKHIVSQVVAALAFAHKKEVYHLDVRPGNIIVKLDESHQYEVLLSDWGCSIHKGKKKIKLQKFRGCTPYAHDSLLGEWSGGVTLRAELDFASLLYTCIHVDKGILQWVDAFDSPLQVSKAGMQMRRDLATIFVQKPGGWFSTLDTPIQETLKSVVLPTTTRAVLRPRRKSQQ
jgi:hypothetical protein